MRTVAERKALMLLIQYSAKFAAETIYMEPPQPLDPTIDNLRNTLARCVRPPREHELPLIRDQFLRDYGKALQRVQTLTEPGLFDIKPHKTAS